MTAALSFAIGGAVLAFILILAWAVTTLRDSSEMSLSERVAIARVDDYAEAPLEPIDTGERLDLLSNLRRMLDRLVSSRTDKLRWLDKIERSLVSADLRVKPHEWIAVVVAICLASGALCLWRFGNLLAALAGAAVGYAVSQGWLRRLQRKRIAAFDSQMVDFLGFLATSLRAGQSLGQALDGYAETGDSPSADEVRRVKIERDLGVPLDEAINNFVARNDREEVRLLAVVLKVHQKRGGNLANSLEKQSGVIRERLRVAGEIRTLTSQGRAEAWIITLIPPVLAAFLAFQSPDFFAPMFQQTLGLVMLGFALAGEFTGNWLMRAVVRRLARDD